MSDTKPTDRRRSYGTGSLYSRADRNGRETWYGKWRTNGRQVKRRIGPKRPAGSREGLTRAQAEAEMRRLIGDVTAHAPVGQRLTVAEVSGRYCRAMEERGRKASSIRAVEQTTRVWLAPFFGEKALDAIRPEDVSDLMVVMRCRGLAPKSIRNYVVTLSGLFNWARSQATRLDKPR